MLKVIKLSNSNRINYKKALAVFLLGQAVSTGAWAAPETIVADIVGNRTLAAPGDNLTVNADLNYGGGAATVILPAATPGVAGITITVGANGKIRNTGGAATDKAINGDATNTAGTVTIVNNGIISSTVAEALDFSAAGTVAPAAVLLNLTNNNTITGAVLGTPNGDTIANSGTITGAVTLGAAANTLTNSGTITGALTGGAAADTITNTGTITGNINLAGGANNFTSSGNVTGNITTGVGADTLTITGGTITGNIDTGGAADTLVIRGAPTIAGTINDTGAGGLAVNIGSGGVATYSTGGIIGGGAPVSNIAVTTAGTVFTANHAVTSTGTFATAAGTTTNINAAVQANGGAFAHAGNLNLGANLNIGGANTLTTAATGTVEMKAASTLTGAYTVQAGGTHITTVDNGTVRTLTTSGAPNFAANSIIEIKTSGTSAPINGQTLRIVDGGGVANFDAATIIKGTKTLSYTRVAPAGGNEIDVIVARTSPTKYVTTESAAATAKVFNDIANTAAAPADFKSIVNAVDNLATESEVTAAITQLEPPVDSYDGANLAVVNTNYTVFNEIGTRIENIARLGIADARTGFAAGNAMANRAMWIKGFGSSNKQKERDGFAGYNANTKGFAIGADNEVRDNTWVGLGLSYGNSHVKTKESPANRTKLDSYQVTLYSSYSPRDYYVDGFVALGMNKYKTQRNIKFATIDRTATADFKGLQPSARVSAGYVCMRNDLRIIPNVSAHYSYVNQKAYDESDAGSISLNSVKAKHVQKLEAGVGLKVALVRNEGLKSFVPDVHVNAFYDVMNSTGETTAQFAGGGTDFTVKGMKPARFTTAAGVGLNYTHKDRMQFSFSYDARKKSKFIGHSGSLAVRYMI